MRLQRLNGDASWWIEVGSASLVFDPWLTGSEIDVARWFHQAWHAEPVVPPERVPDHDLIVVSQPFPDHCHPETLRSMPPGPVAAVPGAADRLRDTLPGPVHVVPPWGEAPLILSDLRLWRLSRPWWRPPAFHAVVVVDALDRAVVHAPHGLAPDTGRKVAERFDVVVLATTRSSYRLPWFLGGAINPGPEAADRLAEACGATHALAIHDEDKRARGLVPWLARIRHAALPEGGHWLVADLDPIRPDATGRASLSRDGAPPAR